MKTNMVFSIVLYLYAFGSGVVLFSNDPVERWSDFNPFIVWNSVYASTPLSADGHFDPFRCLDGTNDHGKC